jgi:uncharacterized protein with von Willebrand factor type A (vWA) domain
MSDRYFTGGCFKDWYKRDKYSFTRRVKSRLGWEDTLDVEDSYSSYFWKPKTNAELIKKAYQTAREMIIVINPPFRVNIQISSDTPSGFTDGRIVAISSKVFDDPVYSEGEKLDIFCGTTIHEGCHLLYTKFADYRKWSGRGNKIKQTIFNILEDERIEETLGDEKPGLVRFLEKSKYYYFDTLYLGDREGKTEKIPVESGPEELLSVFLGIVRYPKYLNEDIVERYDDLLGKIKSVIVPLPKSTLATIEASEEIYKILSEAYKDMNPEGESAEGEKRKDSEGGGSGTEKSSRDMEKGMSRMIDRLERSGVSKDPKYGMDEDSPEFEEKGMAAGEVARDIKFDTETSDAVKELEGTLEFGSTKKDKFTKAWNDEGKYRDSYERISGYIASIRRSIQAHSKNYELIHKSCRSGLLDTDKLAEAYQGVPCVYIRKGEVKTKKVTVCVLIDESGSMCGNDRIEKARDAAVLLNEAFSGLAGVDLFIYGHTADQEDPGDTELTIYREPGYEPKYSLGQVEAKYENRDGRAIEEVAKRIRKKTKDDVLMFILSDGDPSAYNYRDGAAVRDTKRCIDRVEKMGFTPVQVSINVGCERTTKMMFKKYILIKNLADLAPELGKIIKKATLEAAKVETY